MMIMPPEAMGMAMRQKVWNQFAPSIKADSSIFRGTAMNDWRMIKIAVGTWAEK